VWKYEKICYRLYGVYMMKNYFSILSKNGQKKKLRGFVGVVFLAVALIGIIIGSIAKMSREGASSTGDQANRMLASVILKQAADIATAFDRLEVEGKVSSDPEVMRPAGSPYALPYIMPAGSFDSHPGRVGTGYVIFNQMKFVTPSEQEKVVLFAEAPIRDAVCRQINLLIHNESITTTPPSGDLAYSEYLGPEISAGGGEPRMNRNEGCFYEGDGVGMYYKILR
jgi:hypothetical protein